MIFYGFKKPGYACVFGAENDLKRSGRAWRPTCYSDRYPCETLVSRRGALALDCRVLGVEPRATPCGDFLISSIENPPYRNSRAITPPRSQPRQLAPAQLHKASVAIRKFRCNGTHERQRQWRL